MGEITREQVERAIAAARRYADHYAAALTKEEQRRAQEADPMPEPPDGVTVTWIEQYKHWSASLNRVECLRVQTYSAAGRQYTDVATVLSGQHWPPRLVRYAADLAEWASRQHAKSERERLLGAVRVAEEAEREASRALDAGEAEVKALTARHSAAYEALLSARKAARKGGALCPRSARHLRPATHVGLPRSTSRLR